MDLTEKQLSSENIFDGKVLHVRRDDIELPNGVRSMREYVKHIGAVCVVPVTDDGKIILERQYRYAVGQTIIEIPAGKLDSPDEDLREAALRELREETGATPRELIDLGDYYGSPAILSERIRMFLAVGLSFGEQSFDEDELLEVFAVPLDDAVADVLAGKIPDGKTQAGILRAAAMLKVIPHNSRLTP